MCLLLCGCKSVQKMSIQEIIDNGTNKTVNVYNTYRKGYKYNLPKGLGVLNSSDYNEVIMTGNYKYYLYIDAVSYYNKVIETYEVRDNCYYSKPISFEDRYGYIEINEVGKDKYLIEIMYNYAKIEVIVKKADINVTVANAIRVLTSIKFNDFSPLIILSLSILSNEFHKRYFTFSKYIINSKLFVFQNLVPSSPVITNIFLSLNNKSD